ncbi:7256_t:CDS:1, partial [Acaulospora morrowiae]
ASLYVDYTLEVDHPRHQYHISRSAGTSLSTDTSHLGGESL